MDHAHAFGQLTHPRAGVRVLYRVRLRLVDSWRREGVELSDRQAVVDAIGVVDMCLTQLRGALVIK